MMEYPILRASCMFFCAYSLLIPSVAFTQNKGDFVDDKIVDKKKDAKKQKQGFDPSLSIGATVNFTDNRSVVGQNEGSTWTLGANINGALNYLRGDHDIRTSLTINETFTNTPIIPEFLNTSDELKIDATYYYTIPSVPWLGPFAKFEVLTSLFPGFAVFPTNQNFAILERDGTMRTESGDRFQLRNSLAPLQLKESVGMFARPISKKSIEVEFRIGGGAREIFADGQYAIKDDDTTPEIELTELSDYIQMGAEAGLVAKGKLADKRISYLLSFDTLMPFYNSISTQDRSAVELTNFDALFKISFKLVDWASLDYQLKVTRQPLLIDELQVQNNLLLTLGYTLID